MSYTPAPPTVSAYNEAIDETFQLALDVIETTIHKGKPIDRALDLLHEVVDLIRVVNHEGASIHVDNVHIVIGLLHATDHTILDTRDEILTQAARWITTVQEEVRAIDDVLDTQLCPKKHPLMLKRGDNLRRGTNSIVEERIDMARIRREA